MLETLHISAPAISPAECSFSTTATVFAAKYPKRKVNIMINYPAWRIFIAPRLCVATVYLTVMKIIICYFGDGVDTKSTIKISYF